MRCVTLGFLVLLAACSGHGAGGLSGGQPGIDVADAALRGGSAQIALQVVDAILAKDPGNIRALITQGEALTVLGRMGDAEISFSTALQRDPGSVAAHIGLGRLKLASDPVTAEALFVEALQRDPRNGAALNDLGIARDLQGRHADAQDAYRRALAIDASMSAAQVNLALSMAMSGQSRGAVDLLRPLASNPDASPKLRHDLAAVLTMAGQKAEAARILSADLTPADVERALTAYAGAKSAGGATPLVPDSAPLAEAAATPAPAAAPAAAPLKVTALTAPLPAPTTASPPPAASPPPVTAEVLAVPPPNVGNPAPRSTPAPASAAPSPADTAVAATPAPTPAAPANPTIASNAAPAVAAAPASEPPAPSDATNAAHSGAGVRVQLASVDSEAGAKDEWRRLVKRMPDVLDGREPIIVKGELGDGRTVWRLRAGGFDDAAKASEFCGRVHAEGGVCITVQ
jgi:Flp pilus assembly protein TadD